MSALLGSLEWRCFRLGGRFHVTHSHGWGRESLAVRAAQLFPSHHPPGR